MTGKTLNGRHVLAMFVVGFGIIIAVNITLAVNAVQTFPGLEVPNSYVASQSFDARRDAQNALGWSVDVAYADGLLTLHVTDADGAQIDPTQMRAVIGRPTTRISDAPLAFDDKGRVAVELAPGRWRLDLQSGPDQAPFEQALLIEVK